VAEDASVRLPADGAGPSVVRAFTVVLGAGFADELAVAAAVGAAEVVARAVGRTPAVRRGVGVGLLVVAGCPDPTVIVPCIFGWIEQ